MKRTIYAYVWCVTWKSSKHLPPLTFALNGPSWRSFRPWSRGLSRFFFNSTRLCDFVGVGQESRSPFKIITSLIQQRCCCCLTRSTDPNTQIYFQKRNETTKEYFLEDDSLYPSSTIVLTFSQTIIIHQSL